MRHAESQVIYQNLKIQILTMEFNRDLLYVDKENSLALIAEGVRYIIYQRG